MSPIIHVLLIIFALSIALVVDFIVDDYHLRTWYGDDGV